jgi:hypothetical protein
MAAYDFDVHTAETLMDIAELHWRATRKATQAAQDGYDVARRLYASARRDYTAAGRHAAAGICAATGRGN